MTCPTFGTIHAPQTYFQMWAGARSGFYTQVADGNLPSAYLAPLPMKTRRLFNSGTIPNSLCDYLSLHGAGSEYLRRKLLPRRPLQCGPSSADFQTPMNHSYNLTIEQR